MFEQIIGLKNNLQDAFINAEPYPHICIDNFIADSLSKNLKLDCYNLHSQTWRIFDRAGSYMRELWKFPYNSLSQQFANALNSTHFIQWLEQVTGIDGLLPDPHLHGAGWAICSRGDSLKIHTDFNWNDKIKLHRKISLCLYLAEEEWQPNWNGDLQLWDNKKEKCIKSYLPIDKRVVIWEYSPVAFHGHPNEILCPPNVERMVFRMFYYTSSSKYDLNDLPHKSLYGFENS